MRQRIVVIYAFDGMLKKEAGNSAIPNREFYNQIDLRKSN